MNEEKQIDRIKLKLEKVRKLDSEFEEFGASSHKYQINNPATKTEIEEFENTHGIELPIGYKKFLLEIGNGGIEYVNRANSKSGTGPYYGIYQLGVGINQISEFSSSTLRENVNFHSNLTETEWRANGYDTMDKASDEEYERKFAEILSGIMVIGHGGCSNYQGLILNGENRGKVIYIYAEMEYKPHISKEGCFLDWYEAWLDSIIEKKKTTANNVYI